MDETQTHALPPEEDSLPGTPAPEEEPAPKRSFRENLKLLFSCCPKPVYVLFGIAAFCGILQIAFRQSTAFADFFNRYPGAFFRGLFAKLTGWIPFSLAETILMLMPVILTLLTVLAFRISKKGNRAMARYMFLLLGVLSYLFSSFSLGFAAGYDGSTLDRKLQIKREKVSAEELTYTASLLLDELNAMVNDVDFRYGSSSVMPYTLDELNRKLQTACVAAAEKYDFLPSLKTNFKKVVMSEWMTYTHISGVYSYFTGESNLNTNFPDYTLPYTAAHELSHQRGIAREDEANFMAFLICVESDDPYIRYSGYMNLYEYVMSALYKADKDAYNDVLSAADYRLRYEMIAYNSFFKKYEKNVAATVSSAVNDTYLKAQGQKAGERSYGMVVDLAVAYYKGTAE